jgi:ketosteroid isomerase-like protein
MMKRYTDAILAKDIPAWLDLWADEGIFEHPYAPAGYRKSVDGKAAIAEYMSAFPGRFDVKKFTVISVVQNEAGTEGFAEVKAEATILTTGRPYNQHYVGFMRVNDDGKLLLYKDFWNPLVAIEAFGGAQALTDAFEGAKQ